MKPRGGHLHVLLLAAGCTAAAAGWTGGCPAQEGGKAEKKGPPPRRAPAPVDPHAALLGKLSKDTLDAAIKDSKKDAALTVQVEVARDAYRYFLAEGFQQLVKRGVKGPDLWKSVAALDKKSKAHEGKVLVRFKLTGGPNLFLRDGLKNMVALRSKALKGTASLDPTPKLEFDSWQVMEYAPVASRKLSLARFSTLSVDLIVALKHKRQEPLELVIAGIAKQVPSADRHDSLNLQLKQISCKNWGSLLLPAVPFSFNPPSWEPPEMAKEVQELLGKLEAGK